MNLTIDIGNTSTKIIVFKDTIPVYRKITDELTSVEIKRLRNNLPVQFCMLSSVVDVSRPILKNLASFPYFEQLSYKSNVPVKILYKTPHTLGNDRLANAIAGNFLFPKSNVLIIDSGTCIKYDFVNKSGSYLGGSISPGMTMRFKAMHTFTGKLPLVKDEKLKILTGRNTKESMQTGVFFGIAEEIKGIIGLYKKKYKNVNVILTGGDSKRFAKELNLSIFAAPDLVNIGLNEIIRHNFSV